MVVVVLYSMYFAPYQKRLTSTTATAGQTSNELTCQELSLRGFKCNAHSSKKNRKWSSSYLTPIRDILWSQTGQMKRSLYRSEKQS